MRINDRLTHGIFCDEVKNRFRCIVSVDGENQLCYVASSCRLSNFLNLKNREVILLPASKNATATAYTLLGAKTERGYTLLNLGMANEIIREQLYRRYFSFLGKRKIIEREKLVHGYKADLFIPDTNTIIEIKTVLEEKKDALFPTVFSERALRQFTKIKQMLVAGYRVCYIFVALSSKTKVIHIKKDTEFSHCFKECVALGMQYRACGIRLSEENVEICRMLDVSI